MRSQQDLDEGHHQRKRRQEEADVVAGPRPLHGPAGRACAGNGRRVDQAHTHPRIRTSAKCEIDSAKEGEKAGAVTVELAPKFEFKDGKATKVSINIGKIDGPAAVKGAIWTAATAEEYFGLFNDQITAALNKLLLESCPENYPAN